VAAVAEEGLVEAEELAQRAALAIEAELAEPSWALTPEEFERRAIESVRQATGADEVECRRDEESLHFTLSFRKQSPPDFVLAALLE
jgi:hypothetical protein